MVESSNDGKEGEIKEESSPKEEKVCPICAFIEAGPCAEEHKVWVACREQSREAGLDYAEECKDTFKAFLQCCFDNVNYYEPFLESLGISEDALGEEPQAPEKKE